MITLVPGKVIAIRCWWGEHWGIVATDQFGRLTVISNRGIRSGVTEELWNEVVGEANWRIVNEFSSAVPAYFVIERARSKIGTPYDFLKWNCQDFVYWVLGFQPRSPQREAAVGLAAAAFLGLLVLKDAKSS
jgi:hypothetical protein